MKRKKDEEQVDVEKETDSLKLSKMLIREFNKGENKIAWCLGTDHDNPTEVKEFISTGSTLVDYIISNRRDGGIPVGKLTEIVGEEASGKSLLAAHLIAECQKRGGIAVYIDTENAANPDFMSAVGVDINQLVYLQPGSVEAVGEAIEKTIIAVRTKAPNKLCLIVWDSVANCPTKIELEGDFDLNMNLQLEKSKVLSKMMRKLTDIWGKERIAMVFTNQLKTKIGVMFGDPLTTPGGKAIPYAASVRLRLNRSVQLAEGKPKKGEKEAAPVADGETKGGVYGIHTIAKVIKNRLGPPLRRCEFDITFARGVDDESSWFDFLHERGEIERDGGFCYYTAYPSGKTSEWRAGGKDNVGDRGICFREKQWKETLAENPKMRELVLDHLQKHLVVRYDQKEIKDLDLDPESLMDAEGVVEALRAS